MELADVIGLGDHPALDFLNSIATPAQEIVELIGDGRSYLSWLELAGFIGAADQDAAAAAFGPAELDPVAAEAVQLREWLRPLIAAWAVADRPVLPAAARNHLNEILALGRRSLRIETGDDGAPRIHERRSWEDPRQLLTPPAEAVARLFATGDRRLVRHCEGPTCTLWFYDRTKSHRRRWCSMAACGNREKARKHRQQNRTGTS
ncbi:MAG TPA: CGNR zinc finger domain-containing protein [Streptosporangiaceae bacterium]|nr:CGNR zinc finger domain-containing protein [Streptosporangiaceae bacterium]